MTQPLCNICKKPLLKLPSTGECYHCLRRDRQRDAAQRRRENPRALAGVDVDSAVDAFRELPVFADLPRRFRVDVGHTATGGCGGRAFLSKKRPKMRVYGGPETTPERVLEVVLHELCHLALPSGVHHGERFRRTFARAVREAWGFEVPVDVAREHHGNASYKMGEITIERLRELIAEGKIETFPPEPPAPKPSRAEHLAEIVKLREEHAEKMLARAERRLKLAKTVHAKWRAKVSYYEKQAAKRGAK